MKHKLLNIIGIVAVVIAALFATHIIKVRKMTIGIDTKNMDLSARPGDDFYDYATAGWQLANPLTGEYSKYGAFEKLQQENLKLLQDLIKEIAAKEHSSGTNEYKIATLYNQTMDADKLNSDGIAPVIPYLQKIDALKNKAELFEYLADSHKLDGAFWGDEVAEDIMDSAHYLYAVSQAGIGLPEREYYLSDDAKSKNIREKYKKFIADAFEMFGVHGNSAAVYAIEEKLARAHYKKEKLRQPEENYHKVSMAEFAKKYDGFDWKTYFKLRGVLPENINIAQPEAIATALETIKSEPLENLKLYLKWRTISGALTSLSDAQYELSFNFYGKVLSGKTERRPRWKDAVGAVEGTMGEAIGKIYVERYFPASSKEKMLKLVKNLQTAYANRIKNLDWMSDATKEKALEKLGAFTVKIGYPDKWRDYSKLEIRSTAPLYENLRAAARFEDEFWMAKADGQVDRAHWYMNPQEVNAYYNPTTNEICFPAGILQPPFFDANAVNAFNYGAIGVVIGHEMTHGFDDNGRKFDKDGNMKDWWTADDAAAFEKRAKVMKDYFNSIEVAPDVHANGEFTLGENLADFGGVTIAYDAYKLSNQDEKTESDWTPAQIFFIAFAGVWAGNIRAEEVLRRTKEDPHSLSRWRVNGILPHINSWYEAFGIKQGDKLYLAPEKRVSIW